MPWVSLESVNPRCCNELDGGRYRIRTCDFHREKRLPKYTQVAQDIAFCGLGCGLENSVDEEYR